MRRGWLTQRARRGVLHDRCVTSRTWQLSIGYHHVPPPPIGRNKSRDVFLATPGPAIRIDRSQPSHLPVSPSQPFATAQRPLLIPPYPLLPPLADASSLWLEGFEKLPPARGDREREDDGRARAAAAPRLGAARSDPRLRPGNLSAPIAIRRCPFFFHFGNFGTRFVMVGVGFGRVACSCCTSRSTRTSTGGGSSPRRTSTKVCACIYVSRLCLSSLWLARSVPDPRGYVRLLVRS